MPGPESHLQKQLARRVRELRGARDLTLAALATRADVSKGMLIQIEQSAVNPSLGVLVRVADALGVSLSSLLDEGGSPRVRVFDTKEQQTYWRGKRGSAAILLGGAERPNPLECWRWTISPGDAYVSHAHPKGTEEIVVVLRGTLTLEVEASSVNVAAGSCVVFDADVDHAYRNAAKRGHVELVMLVATPAMTSPQPATPTPNVPARRKRTSPPRKE